MAGAWIMVAAVAVYPLAVLGVALTGPHSESERRINQAERASPLPSGDNL